MPVTTPRLGSMRAVPLLLLAACAEPLATRLPAPGQQVPALPEGSPGRIEVRRLEAKPILTLVAREGDPAPAVAVVLATDLGPGLTAALAAVVESRLRAAGVEADVRVDRDAFRVRASLSDAGRAEAFLAAVAAAAGRPIAAGGPEIALAVQRLQSLRRRPLDAPELSAAAACTGALGIAPGEPLPDLASEAGLRELEGARRAALHTGNIAVAAVGPAAFGAAVAHALERCAGWPPSRTGSPAQPGPPSPPSPAADVAGVYTAPGLDRRGARLTLAARVADPVAAASAAERLGAPDSPLVARLRLLPEPWHVAQVAGVARAHGGACVGLVLETAQRSPALPIEPSAGLAVAVARREASAELALGGTAAVAGRQILTAADPREAASRAAWWSLAGAVAMDGQAAANLRWTAALGIPVAPDRAVRDTPAAADAASAPRFQAEIERALGSAATAGAERRLSVEHGQGELWVLLASPCGVAEEGTADAGLGALATLAAVEARRRADGVAFEPWITADGIGVLAHAPSRDEHESPAELARRVGDAAARAFTATSPPAEAAAAARAAVLEHLERTAGVQAAALATFAAAASPDHPSWLEPFGLWSKVAGAGSAGLRLRAQAMAQGPLRLAVLANADLAQATATGDAVDRWLAPVPGPRICRAGSPEAPRPGRYEARLPDGAPLAQGLVGAPVPPPGAAGRDLAELTAAALDAPGGLLAAALAEATASARLVGGARAPTLVVDVRAPSDGLSAAVADVKALLLRLPTTVADADLARASSAWERREQEARADPRRRIVELWSGGSPGSPPSGSPGGRAPGGSGRPSLAAWRAFLGGALREATLVVVEARPQ
jgi:hypothetical protein